jgi:predicted nucleic-acid-binding protein
MRAIDANVLVRLLIRDDARQAASADAFVKRGAWVSVLALAETVWVLDAVYDRRPAEIALAIELLLNHEHLVLQDADAAEAALELFHSRPALGFSDCLMLTLARKAGHLSLGTFDRKLARLEGAERV